MEGEVIDTIQTTTTALVNGTASMTNDVNEATDCDIQLVVTGFGPFHGVEVNPTMLLVQELYNFCIKRQTSSQGEEDQVGDDDRMRINKCIEQARWIVLDTSAKNVDEQLANLRKEITNSTDSVAAATEIKSTTEGSSSEIEHQSSGTKTHVKRNDDNTKWLFVHLGVNYRGTGFQLEQCAYNNASFRVPDNEGYQPTDKEIVSTIQLESRCDTNLDVPMLTKYMCDVYPDIETTLSIDPGRFVCNYLYYSSLYQCQTITKNQQQEQQRSDAVTSSAGHAQCLFVHVPPLEVASKEIQLEYVSTLITHLLIQSSSSDS